MFDNLLINLKFNTQGMGQWYNATRKMNQSLSNINKDANRSAEGIAKLTGSLSGMNQVIGIGKLALLGTQLAKTIQGALDMTETVNLFSVAMGDTAVDTNKFVQEMSKAYGLDPTNLQNAIGTFGLLSRSMGMSTGQAEVLSTNMSKLAIDLASLTNVPINQVMADLKSGLVGQSETVYKYGMDVTEAGIKAEAMNQGIKKSVRDMSQGEKMALRYSAMLKQSALTQGDFANTITSPANQLKILSERFITLGRAVGSIFLPLLQATLPYLNAFVMILTDVANAIAKFFGFIAPQPTNGVGKALSNISDGADDSTDAVDGTTKALKKMKNATMGFDEINVLPKQPDDSGAGGGKGKGGIGDSILPKMDLSGYDNMMSKIKGIGDELKAKMLPVLKEIAIVVGIVGLAFLSWELANFILNVKLAFKGLTMIKETMIMIQKIGLMTTLKGFFPEFVLAGGIFLVLSGLILLFIGLKKILDETKPSWEALGIAIAGVVLIAGGLALIFSATVGVIALVVGVVVLLGVYIYKYWDEICAYTSKVWGEICKFFTDLWTNLSKGFSDMLENVKKWFVEKFTAISDFVTVTIPKMVDDITNWISALPNKIAYWLGYALGSFVKWVIDTTNYLVVEIPKVIDSVVKFFAGLPDKIFTAISFLKDKISLWVTNCISWISTEVPKAIAKVVEFFSGIPQKVLDAINFVGGKITTWKDNMIYWFNNEVPKIINAVVDWFRGLPSRIYDAIDGMWSTITSIGSHIIDGIFAGLKGFKNKITGWGDSFVQGFKDALGIHSPSRVMRDEVGVFLGQGIQLGLEKSTDGIVGTATSISDSITGAFSDVSIVPNMSVLSPNSMLSNANLGMDAITGNMSSAYNVTSSYTTEFTESVYTSVFKAMTDVFKANSSDEKELVLKVGSTEFGRVAIDSINKITKQEGKLALNI